MLKKNDFEFSLKRMLFVSLSALLISLFISTISIYNYAFADDFMKMQQNVQSKNQLGCAENSFRIPINSKKNPQIYKMFDKNLGKYEAGHRGLDLRVNFNSFDERIIAPIDGKILWKGVVANEPTFTFGNSEIKNTFQRASTSLKTGQTIKAGEIIGVAEKQPEVEEIDSSGQTIKKTQGHCDDQECLHWGVINLNNDEYVDPFDMIYRKRIILKR